MIVEHGEFVERVGPGQHGVHLVAIDRLRPRPDQQGRHRVAGEVGQRPGFGHEPVDADDQADTVEQVGAVCLQAAGQRGQPGAGDTGGTLGGDDHEHQQADLLGHAQRITQGAGDEQRGHRQIDRGPVQIERVAGGNHHADGRAVDAQVLHLGDQARQRRLRRGRRHDQQVLAGQVAHQLEDRHAGHRTQQRAEHTEHEDRAGQVEADHQRHQLPDRRPAGLPDDIGDGTERTDRGQPQDHHQHLEDQLLQVLDTAQDRVARRTETLDRETHQQRDEQRLQHAALGQRREQRCRDDALDEVQQTAGLMGLVGEFGALTRSVGDVEPFARVQQVADDQTDAQREGRHRQEVDEGQPADLADGRSLTHRSDAEHDGAEDHRCDHHLDQRDEHGAEHADALAHVGGQDADGDTGDDRDDHRDVEPMGTVPLGFGRVQRRRRRRRLLGSSHVRMVGHGVSQVTF